MPQDTAAAMVTGKCSNPGSLTNLYAQSAINVIIDWILVLLPIPSIFGTIMDRKIRISIIGILLLGAGQASRFPSSKSQVANRDNSGSVASIIRLVYLHTFFSKNPGELFDCCCDLREPLTI